ncbi:MAG: hypothetical protein IIB77_11455, partial [Proteobacteria bacterium]|nr:hypothetical protein [Pseudomonadota bacterium]
MCLRSAVAATAVVVLGAQVANVQAEVVIETVTVGNPGNAPDARYETPGYGSVDYVYNIGTFEVTVGQYAEFLNAVAATDKYGLYNTSMWSSAYGCKIIRIVSSGSFTYAVAGAWGTR